MFLLQDLSSAPFSDANWISMGGLPGADGVVGAAVVDGSGNLYIGGDFTIVGDAIATNIAKWDGSSWSALGSGMNSNVYALAVSGSDLYAGGLFTMAGGSAASYVAKWDGNTWSALGSGLDGAVNVLAVSGGDVYAGGNFTTVTNSGGLAVAVGHVAKWDGTSWSALAQVRQIKGRSKFLTGSLGHFVGFFVVRTCKGLCSGEEPVVSPSLSAAYSKHVLAPQSPPGRWRTLRILDVGQERAHG